MREWEKKLDLHDLKRRHCVYLLQKGMEKPLLHLLAEYYRCDPGRINDMAFLEAQLLEAARICGATVIDSRMHAFSPQGITGVVLLQESHISIHTWPEHAYVAVDIFICGSGGELKQAFNYLEEALMAKRSLYLEVKRGNNYVFSMNSGPT
ncbi:MAG: adenosylmethionine decarboxylase [Bacteroidetes bacterium]|nr:MAG: adenosylmethionine decarboxylase [Bacteroidota bacterium]